MRRAAAAFAFVALAACTRDNRWKITNAYPQGVALVAFGDSLTSGYQMGAGESYPEQLSARIGRPILNRGVSGDSTAEGLARLERDVLGESPRIVIVGLGANDMLRRQPIDPAFANLRAIVDRIHAQRRSGGAAGRRRAAHVRRLGRALPSARARDRDASSSRTCWTASSATPR